MSRDTGSASTPPSSSSSTFVASLAVSFLVGAVTSTAAWWCYLKSIARDDDNNNDNDNDGSSRSSQWQNQQRQLAVLGTTQQATANSTFLRWPSMDDLKSRIGELPSLSQPRTRWPWDRKTRSRSQSPMGAGGGGGGGAGATHGGPHPVGGTPVLPFADLGPEAANGTAAPNDDKSDFCIGSIFGLDVGGTLAKLVYFEQKSEQCYDSEIRTTHPRQRSYQKSASAKAVLLARRGGAFDDKSDGITMENHDEERDSRCAEWHEKENAQSPEQPSSSYRRRSLSVAEQRFRRSSLSPSRRRSSAYGTTPLLRHSEASNDDLKTLYDVRVESVPDDLHAYAQTVLDKGSPCGPTHHTTDTIDAYRMSVAAKREMDALSSSLSSSIRKSKSMLDISKGRTEALDRFYSFARRLDSYREGVKDHKLSFYSRQLGGEFHFIRFESRRMQNAMDLIRANQLHLNIREMGATGGGAHKYASHWEAELGITMKKQDELDSLVAGMQFVLSTVVGECYTFRPCKRAEATASALSPQASMASSDHAIGASIHSSDDDDDDDNEVENGRHSEQSTGRENASNGAERRNGKVDEWWWSRKVQRDAISGPEYPYLLVTIGTGVSIVRVDGPRKHVRVSGSTIGGGTYWGLIRLLTDLEDFDAVLRLAERGDPTKVDMMVGDIYGNSNVVEKMGLRSDLVASSFGKLVAKDDPASGLKEEDLARALLLMITINIGQVAYLNAQLHKTSRIYFVGNFLRENKISQRRLSFAIDYWSKGEMEALFLEHEGYFGALGAFLLSQGISQASLAAGVGGGPILGPKPDAGGDLQHSRLHKRSETIGFV